MKNNVLIIILILILVLISFLLFMKVNSDYQQIEQMKGEQLNVEKKYLNNLSELTAGYNELQSEYDKLLIKLEDEEWEYFKITGYSINDPLQGTTDIVKTGFCLNDPAVKKLPIIAVDPKVIELYSIVEIKGLGAYIALDTGGNVIGKHIDILFDSKEEANEFGVRELFIRIIN